MPELPRSLRVEAVVLRHSDWGEADRLLNVYTREVGKLRVLAKGARRMRSRKAGHLQPFTRSTLLLSRGREIWIVTQAETVDAYLPIGADLLRTGYAAYVIELLDRFTYEEGENRLLYRLLVETLSRVAHQPDPFVAVRYYDLQLLDLLGFRPELSQCVQCGALIQPQDQFFSAAQGGALCPGCGVQAGALPVSLPTLKYLRHLQRSTWAVVEKAGLPEGVRAEMEALLGRYLSYLLERGLNTPRFLREVRHVYQSDGADDPQG